MKTSRILAPLLAVLLLGGCDAFRTLTRSKLKTAQGSPYELIVVAEQREWMGPVGDTLRAILRESVPYLNQTEPLFDVLRVRGQDFAGMIADHRNILKVVVDPSLTSTGVGVAYDVTAEPQIVLTLQGPDQDSMAAYLSAHRGELTHVLEQAERDRDLRYAERFGSPAVERAALEIFGVEMYVPKGYVLAARGEDFLWARYEYPSASQGFFLYAYPYQGPQSMGEEALLAARNRFAARIPGPSEGSYMTTSEVFPPAFGMFRLEGRVWSELRGFWDVEGDFMGGPFVSYSTVDAAKGRVFTLDGYVYSPKLPKRNFLRGVEHLLYSVRFGEDAGGTDAAAAKER